jgi:hypothetical protein
MKLDEILSSKLSPMKPPSFTLKEYFDNLVSYPPSEADLCDLSKEVLLPVEEIKLWLEHLHTVRENRKKGAIKATESRKKKKQPQVIIEEHEYECGVCHTPYQNFTHTEEQWIGCEHCDSWYHFKCVGVSVKDVPDVYLCSECVECVS